MKSFFSIFQAYAVLLELKKHIGINIFWLLIDKVLRFGASLLTMILIARHFGPAEFGALSFAMSIVAIFGSLASMGLQSIVVRDIIQNQKEESLILGSAGFVQFIAGLLSYCFLVLTIVLFLRDGPTIQLLTLILGATLFVKFTEIGTYFFESKIESKYTVWITNSCNLLFVSIKVYLIHSGASLYSIAFVTLSEVVASGLLVFLAMQIKLGQKLSINLKRCDSLMRDGFPLLLASTMILIYMRLDQIMLIKLSDLRQGGIYSAAVRIGEIWYLIPAILVQSLYPVLVKCYRENKEEYLAKVMGILRILFLTSVISAVLMSIFSQLMINTLYGNQYVESGLILSIHLWSSIFVFMGVIGSSCYVIQGLQYVLLTNTILGVVLLVFSNYFLIPRFGAVGASISLLMTQMFVSWLFDYIHPQTRPLFFLKLKSMNLMNFRTIENQKLNQSR